VTKFFGFIFTLVLVFSTLNAEAARRMGSGKSVGQQSGNVTQREAVKPLRPQNPPRLPQPLPPLNVHGVPCWVVWLQV